mmetsp:Transcript_2599/g.7771  ORF Transcript_2599/g.7771 Transcript_2599/m.7771 type:complete len:278 (+) Transcript_2599:248-1081(+)
MISTTSAARTHCCVSTSWQAAYPGLSCSSRSVAARVVLAVGRVAFFASVPLHLMCCTNLIREASLDSSFFEPVCFPGRTCLPPLVLTTVGSCSFSFARADKVLSLALSSSRACSSCCTRLSACLCREATSADCVLQRSTSRDASSTRRVADVASSVASESSVCNFVSRSLLSRTCRSNDAICWRLSAFSNFANSALRAERDFTSSTSFFARASEALACCAVWVATTASAPSLSSFFTLKNAWPSSKRNCRFSWLRRFTSARSSWRLRRSSPSDSWLW